MMEHERKVIRPYIFCSESKKCVWVDIPKAASSSVRKYFSENLHDFKTLSAVWHAEIIEQEKFEAIDLDCFLFCIVRNPWDRLVSNYKMLKNRPHRFQVFEEQYKIYFNEEFDRSYLNSFVTFCELVPDIIKVEKAYMAHFRNQIDFLYREPDFIGRFENLDEDFNTICDQIKIPRRELPHVNKTTHTHYTEYYDIETQKMVENVYAKDIDYFGYKFGE